MTLPERCGTLIVGGGPAGSALAALLARAGERPVLVERDRFPREKLCGEFLSMEAQGHLRELGCLDAVLALAPAEIRRARFVAPSGRSARFPLGGTALGIGRRVLDQALLEHARASGAEVFEGHEAAKLREVPGGVEAAVVLRGGRESRLIFADLAVVAGGRQSAPPPPDGAALFAGLKRRHRPVSGSAAAALAGLVEVHLFPGGYCGVSAVEDGAVNVCLLAEQRWLAALDSPRWESAAAAMARLSPSLRERLAMLEPAGDMLATARVRLDAADPGGGRILRVGDAAGMIAPLCGDGQAMALESALLLAELIAAGGPGLGKRWVKAWRRRFSIRLRLGRGLQGLLLRPAGAEAAAAVLGRLPSLAGALVRLTRGPKSRGSFDPCAPTASGYTLPR
ncbi:MAG: FAD-dependent monooxygenase [Elusimicrobia bacterium]|nr:FAD-dependent monooxygenase [Elusimicrobiota bacterium]